MGWWSETIMGGDTPLDYQGIFYDIAQINQFKPRPSDKGKLLNALPDLLAAAKNPRWSGQEYIPKQVLGVLVMQHGLPLNDLVNEALELAIQGAQEELSNKEDLECWSDPSRRKFYLENFVILLQNYNGESTEIPEEGLLEKMLKLSQGNNNS